ncbi:hypothetical protein INS90_01795 [Trueperella pecoris]|uniref:Uncharacterized protein n=1 Tax=Trueperella pecoris TaxID=2733571 RepID=A0A7M1R3I5_9ACTO|nr:hypothetical protein [Trueperella pecoris]QOR48057.1 hypothetical protein INS90_01795 [Trueperella pecoris]
MKNEKSDGELSGALAAAWEKYKTFWEAYAELFAGKGSQSDVGSYEDLAIRLRCWREGPGDKELDDLLEYLVHPDDLKAFRGENPPRVLKFTEKHWQNMKQFVYGLKNPYVEANDEDSKEYQAFDGEQPVPMLPQPYYGRLENAKIVVVLNNPAYDPSVWEDGSAWGRIKGRMEAHLAHLKGGAPVVPWDPDTQWLPEDGGYYLKNYNPLKEDPNYLIHNFSAEKEREGVRASDFLFHVDMIPYQSASGGDSYMDKIWSRLEELPSVQETLKLLYAIYVDTEDRAIVFRSPKSLRVFQDYVCDQECRGRGVQPIRQLYVDSEWGERIFMMSSTQKASLTFGNLTVGEESWLVSGESVEQRKARAKGAMCKILGCE